jgi:YbbR domain-containing protein
LKKLKKGNILIWALSLVIAVVLWGYVVFYVNPEGDISVSGIPVEFINESALTGKRLMLVDGRDTTIDLRFTGRMQNLVGINKDTVTAVINLRDTNATGDILMEYEIRGPAELDYLTIHRIRPVVSVTIDRISSKYVDLQLDLAGEFAEGYDYDPAVFEPARIYITGPATELDAVHSAVARYEPPDPISRSVSYLPTDYTLYTESGDIVESEYITADYDEVWLSFTVFMVKTVPLVINFVEGGGLTESNIIMDISPASVRIAGDPELLADIGRIVIAQIDLASLLNGLDHEVYAIPYPEGVKNRDNRDEAEASIQIVGVTTRDFNTMNINIKGLVLPEGYAYNLVSGMVTVTLRGPLDELNHIQPNDVRIVADFSDEAITSAGRYRRTAEAYVDGSDTVGAVKKGYEVVIDVAPIPEDEPQ